MARPKAFDPDHALLQAMELFWDRGYEATSMSDLEEHLGLSRTSIYGTFGSKDALYGQALRRYRDLETTKALRCLEDGTDVRDRIRRLFEALAHDGLVDPANRGCMILNAAMERPHDAATSRQVRSALKEIEQALRELLQEGQQRGELDDDKDPRQLAQFLTSSLQGVRLMAKATQDKALLDASIVLALSVLD